jgi:hypothetical protein
MDNQSEGFILNHRFDMILVRAGARQMRRSRLMIAVVKAIEIRRSGLGRKLMATGSHDPQRHVRQPHAPQRLAADAFFAPTAPDRIADSDEALDQDSEGTGFGRGSIASY